MSTTTRRARSRSPGERDAYGRPLQRGIVGAEVYRSDDAGASWRKVSPPGMERFGGTYGWVFGQIRVDPNSTETIYIMGLGLSKSTDGGKTYQALNYAGLHGDHHGLWIDPNDSSHLINTNDGGVNISYDGGRTWRDFHEGIPAVQFYNVDPRQLDPVLGLRLGPGPGHLSRPDPAQKADDGRPGGRAPALRRAPAQVGDRPGRRRNAHRRRPGGPRHDVFVVLLRPPRALRL